MKRDTLTLVIVLFVATGMAVLLRNHRRSHTTPALRTESAQDESLGPEGTITAISNSVVIQRPVSEPQMGRYYVWTGTKWKVLGIYIENGPFHDVSITNPNNCVVKWNLPDGTWTATWTKD